MPVATRGSSKSSASVKPYDRPAAKGKGKGKAVSATGKKAAAAPALPELGAPAQHTQSSRKGKKAWRKNIDVRAEEEALERAREEERVTGGRLGDKKDGDLFTIDTTGDVEVKKKMRVKKPLRSLAILQERSAVPSLTMRAFKPPKAKKISSKEKNHLRKIARRTIDASSSADVRTTDTSGIKDAWGDEAPELVPEGGFGAEGMFTPAVRPPKTLARHYEIRLDAIASQRGDELPETGISYNPAAEAHSKLIAEAVEEELGRLRKEAKHEENISILGKVVEARRETLHHNTDDYVDGMRVGRGENLPLHEESDEDEDEDEDRPAPKKATKRKTQAQRNKAARVKAAAQAAKEETMRKKIANGVSAAKSMSKSVEARAQAAEEAKRLRRAAATQRERLLHEGGEKVGKHRVAKSAIAVQLGEDLSESLRQVKPEGNRFKDFFLSVQRRALLEPRVPQLPKRRAGRTKEYEKHAYKRFK